MTFNELLKDEFAEGKAEGRSEGKVEFLLMTLSSKGEVSESLSDKIKAVDNSEILDKWMAIALNSYSIEDFIENIS